MKQKAVGYKRNKVGGGNRGITPASHGPYQGSKLKIELLCCLWQNLTFKLNILAPEMEGWTMMQQNDFDPFKPIQINSAKELSFCHKL